MALGLVFMSFPQFMKQPGIASHKILVATDKMRSGPFDKAVIFVLEHNHYNTIGLMLNRPPRTPGEPYAGGPVEPNVYCTLHSLDVSTQATVRIAALDIGYTKGEDFSRKVEHGDVRPQEHMVFRGYTGWGRGQLQREIDAGAWKIVDPGAGFIFHTKPDKMWDAAMALPAAAQQQE